jgi:hypothetical protein
MATKYCALCKRPVEARRHIGAGTLVLAVLTGGLWLVTIPFYSKRCCICRSAAVSDSPPETAAIANGRSLPARLTAVEQRLAQTEGELDLATGELDRLRAERDFYRDLVSDPIARAKYGRS